MRWDRRTAFFWLLFLPGMVGGEVVIPPVVEFDPAAVLSDGLKAEKARDYRRAVRTYLEGLEYDPQNADLRNALNRAARRLDVESRQGRKKTIKRFSRDARMKYEGRYAVQQEWRDQTQRALDLIEKRQLLEASFILNNILTMAPGLDEAHSAVRRLVRHLGQRLKHSFPTVQHHGVYEGHYHFHRGEWEQAVGAFRAAINAGPIPDDLAVGRAQDYLALAEKKWAEDQWAKERENLLTSAVLAQRDGKLREARSYLEKILAREPAHAEALDSLSKLGAVDVVVRKAVREEEKLKEIPPLLARGSRLMMDGEYSEAVEVLSRVLVLDPENRQAINQLNEAKRLLQGRGLYVPPVEVEGSAEDRYKEGLKLYGSEQYDEARQAFEDVLKLDPRHQEARLALQRLKDQKR